MIMGTDPGFWKAWAMPERDAESVRFCPGRTLRVWTVSRRPPLR